MRLVHLISALCYLYAINAQNANQESSTSDILSSSLSTTSSINLSDTASSSTIAEPTIEKSSTASTTSTSSFSSSTTTTIAPTSRFVSVSTRASSSRNTDDNSTQQSSRPSPTSPGIRSGGNVNTGTSASNADRNSGNRVSNGPNADSNQSGATVNPNAGQQQHQPESDNPNKNSQSGTTNVNSKVETDSTSSNSIVLDESMQKSSNNDGLSPLVYVGIAFGSLFLIIAGFSGYRYYNNKKKTKVSQSINKGGKNLENLMSMDEEDQDAVVDMPGNYKHMTTDSTILPHSVSFYQRAIDQPMTFTSESTLKPMNGFDADSLLEPAPLSAHANQISTQPVDLLALINKSIESSTVALSQNAKNMSDRVSE